MRKWLMPTASLIAVTGLLLGLSAASAQASTRKQAELPGRQVAGLGIGAALRLAAATGHPVAASALTTATELVTARPDGTVTVQSFALPVRVRSDGRWVSVTSSTATLASVLEPDADGSVTGNEEDYDPVSSGAGCTGSHWNSADYPYSPVGYDNFGGGPCETDDTDYALYRIDVPSLPSGATLVSASFQTAEVYSSSCSATATVTTSWIDAINSSTGWPGPALDAHNVNATASVGPDANSCDDVDDPADTVASGFNVLADIQAIGSATNITFRLWENGNTNEDDHKQFTDNPDLSLTYST
jgi:hypothetical protein